MRCAAPNGLLACDPSCPGKQTGPLWYAQWRRIGPARGREVRLRKEWLPWGRLPLLAVLCIAPALVALQFWGRGYGEDPRAYDFDPDPNAEFQFVRYAYGSGDGYRRRRRGGWRTDWPAAEYHLTNGISRLTVIDTAYGGKFLDPLDNELFDYPWIYAVEVGGWYLDDNEAQRLREYLLRGGFLMVDDFHGPREWAGFTSSLQRVFPERPIVEIPDDDPLLHTLFDLDQRTQIPGIQYLWSGTPYEKDGYTPHWRGVYDDDGRLMVAINFNMDMGDAWEHADLPEYPENMTALAYRFAVNYVIYAMTH